MTLDINSLMNGAMYLSLAMALFSFAYSIYMGYLNYKQAKVVELIRETNEILKRIASSASADERAQNCQDGCCRPDHAHQLQLVTWSGSSDKAGKEPVKVWRNELDELDNS